MRVLLVPSAVDCDPTEVAIPWLLLTQAGHTVTFATSTGAPPQADPRMLTGADLGPFAPVLKARADAISAWHQLAQSNPPTVKAEEAGDADCFVFPGGHAPGMRPYLESPAVQDLARRAFAANKVVGAICHGVVVLARAGVLKGKQTTSLTKQQELLAWNLTRWFVGDYYRTYPQTVQDEVTAALAQPSDYHAGPAALLRDDPEHLSRGFVVEDGSYVSARWPGDVYAFTAALLKRL